MDIPAMITAPYHFLAFLLVESKNKASLVLVRLLAPWLNCRLIEMVESESGEGLGRSGRN
jgi:hypothetical protein